MIRLVLYLALSLVVALGAAWLISLPGTVEIAFGSLDGDAEWLRPDQAPERFKAWTSSCPSGTGPLHWYSGGAKVGKLTPKAGWEDPLRMVLQRTQDAFHIALPARTA